MKKIFNTTQSDLVKYNGTEVEVGEELTDKERDPEARSLQEDRFGLLAE